MTAVPFRIEVPDETLDDLRRRLQRTRYTTSSHDEPWRAGFDPVHLRDLVEYWIDGFDWRAQEAALNARPQFLAKHGVGWLHFLHVRARRPAGSPAPLPILLSHGWPSSFVEMLPLVSRLTDPADGHDAFDVVVPSLPGFLFSDTPDAPVTREAIADTLHTLMTDVLGYERYGAFGGDVGGAATAWLGARYPEHVVGIHLLHPPTPDSYDDPPLAAAERAYLAAEAEFDALDGGYDAIMRTRPDTLAAALTDSPAGLAAWILDKYRSWSNNPGTSLDRDTLLTVVTLYWATGAIGSTFRQYLDRRHNTPRPPITVPAAFTLPAEPAMAGFPRSIAERCCTDIRHWSQPGRGGHFLPMDEPDLLAAELRSFFRPLREP